MGNSCTSLDSTDNPCLLATCLDAFLGFDANSMSPSDIGLLTLKKGTRYRGRRVDLVFLKMWIATPPTDFALNDLTLFERDSLFYEMDFYAEVVAPLVEGRAAPFFVRSLASSKSCTFQQAFQLYRKAASRRTLDDADLEERMLRNFAYMLTLTPRRPAIQKALFVAPPPPAIRRELEDVVATLRARRTEMTFAFLFTESFVGARTLDAFFAAHVRDRERLAPVLFQIAWACHALTLSRAAHNDLHYRNAFVVTHDEPVGFLFTWVDASGRKRTATVFLRDEIRIYDFDRAFAVRLGPNPSLGGPQDLSHPLGRFNQTNEVLSNRDFVKVAVGFVAVVAASDLSDGDARAAIEWVASPLTDRLEDFLRLTRGDFFKIGRKPARDEDFARLRSSGEILSRWMDRLPRGSVPPVATRAPPSACRSTVRERVTLDEADFDPMTGEWRPAPRPRPTKRASSRPPGGAATKASQDVVKREGKKK